MNPRRVASFVDAVVSDRRPPPFKADPAEADILRAAIAMRAGRSGEGSPEPQFVAHLRQELALKARQATASPSRPRVTRRTRLLLGAAAAVTMIGGTVAATTTVERALSSAKASHVGSGQLLRVGQFESSAGHTVGQIVAYRGNPSWVLMSIRDPGMNGPVTCRVQMSNGRTAATGSFAVRNGVAEFARTISVDTGQFRKATLVTAGGSVVATATFLAAG
jgi:hypothetical protein